MKDNAPGKRKYFISELLPSVAVFFIYFLLCSFIRPKVFEITIFTYDSFGCLALPAKLAHYDWSYALGQTGYYGPGAAVPYIPIFKLFSNPLIIYNFIYLILNIIQAFAALILWHLLDKYVAKRQKVLTAVAAIIGTYFTNYIIKDIALFDVEHMTSLLIVVLAALICMYIREKSFLKTVLICAAIFLLSVYSIVVHIRNIVFAVGILSVYIYVVLTTNLTKKRIIISGVLVSVILIVYFLLYRYVPLIFKELLFARYWEDSIQKHNMSIRVDTGVPLLETIVGTVYVLLGNIYQSIKQTYGIVIISYGILIENVVHLFGCVKNRSKSDQVDIPNVLFIYSSSMYVIGLLGTAITWHGSNRGMGYWRYYGTYTALMISISFIRALNSKFSKEKRLLTYLAAILSFGSVLALKAWTADYYVHFWFVYSFLQDGYELISSVFYTFGIVLIGITLLVKTEKYKLRVLLTYFCIFCFIPYCFKGSLVPFVANSKCDTGYLLISELDNKGIVDSNKEIYFSGSEEAYGYYQFMMLDRGVTMDLPENDKGILVFSDDSNIKGLSDRKDWKCIQLDDNEYVYSKDKSLLEDIQVILDKII